MYFSFFLLTSTFDRGETGASSENKMLRNHGNMSITKNRSDSPNSFLDQDPQPAEEEDLGYTATYGKNDNNNNILEFLICPAIKYMVASHDEDGEDDDDELWEKPSLKSSVTLQKESRVWFPDLKRNHCSFFI